MLFAVEVSESAEVPSPISLATVMAAEVAMATIGVVVETSAVVAPAVTVVNEPDCPTERAELELIVTLVLLLIAPPVPPLSSVPLPVVKTMAAPELMALPFSEMPLPAVN